MKQLEHTVDSFFLFSGFTDPNNGNHTNSWATCSAWAAHVHSRPSCFFTSAPTSAGWSSPRASMSSEAVSSLISVRQPRFSTFSHECVHNKRGGVCSMWPILNVNCQPNHALDKEQNGWQIQRSQYSYKFCPHKDCSVRMQCFYMCWSVTSNMTCSGVGQACSISSRGDVPLLEVNRH